MPSVNEFEEFLSHLTNDGYDDFVQSRIERLDPEQQKIAQAREVKRKDRQKLVEKCYGPGSTEEDHENLYNALRDGTDSCEHGRPTCKPCIACAKIDHTMFPELYNEFGEHYQDDE